MGYDPSGRQTTVTAKKGTTTLVSRGYVYTSATGKDIDLRSKVTDQTGSVTSYGYDPLNRLTSAVARTSAGTQTASYGYDPAGNRLTGPEGTHSYNAADELVDPGFGLDGAGNQTTGGGLSASYNPLGQTASVTSGGTTTGFTYTDLDSTQRTQAGSTSFANTLLGLTAQTTGGTTTAFTRDPSGNLISMRTSTGSSYYTPDALGSVLLLTDSTGATTAAYSYDPYGRTLTSSGSQATVNPYRYAGGYTDPSGLVKFGTRYYRPTLGRWTQQDPIPGTITGPQPLNRYPYVGDEPVNRSDLSGRGFFAAVAAVVTDVAVTTTCSAGAILLTGGGGEPLCFFAGSISAAAVGDRAAENGY